jgi:hypothetical protein
MARIAVEAVTSTSTAVRLVAFDADARAPLLARLPA